jgi:4-hydroxy-tetrahydrodipicolinate synthase
MDHFSGVYAALLTPRNTSGELDLEGFGRQFNAPAAGLQGYAVSGATGEFPCTRTDELASIVEATCKAAPEAEIFCGIGAADVRGAVSRGRIAANAGAHGVLLPMPGFFPYRQDDLRSFALAVAEELTIPVLLYNLPQFTTGFEVETVLSLIAEHDNIIGIKDSSGSLDIVRAMTEQQIVGKRIIGNDAILCDALEQGLCDGVVSGVACALPELVSALFATKGKGSQFPLLKETLQEFLEQVESLPTPWGLKVASAVRGFTPESYPFPLSAERWHETAALRGWFRGWHTKAISTKAGAAA